jgi:superfamily II DNA or RNA helicase
MSSTKVPTILDNRSENTILAALKRLLLQARRLDIATGAFEIGALAALAPDWKPLEGLRVLMGDETTRRTKQELLQALMRVNNENIETEKERDDTLTGIAAVREAITRRQIQVRVYSQSRFHAKAYLVQTGAALPVNFAIVGSSNCTTPGLTQNLELNLLTSDQIHVDELRRWYEGLWEEAEEVNAELLKVIEPHLRQYSPFEVYVKALYEFFLGREKTQESWERTEAAVYEVLSRYQRDGYHRALQIAEEWGGALICDGVGLGKTFIGLMLIERYLHEGKRVLLLVPKSALESVWLRWIKRYLRPRYGRAVREQLYIHTHTELEREGTISAEDYDYFKRYVDAVIVDEAHHFRHAFRKRAQCLYSLTGGKKIYLLTATPINNSLDDLYFLICYLIPRVTQWECGRFVPRQDYFSRIGIRDLRAHFNEAEAKLDQITDMTVDEAALAGDFLRTDALLRAILIQRSRRYVRESEKLEEGAPLFPERKPPQIIEYSLKKVYAGIYDDIVTAFSRKQPLVTLAAYNSEAYRKAAPDEKQAGYQRLVVGLIRTLLLKRLESSYKAFEASLEELLKKMAGFLNAHDPERFEGWKARHRDQWETVLEHQRARFIDESAEDLEETDLLEEPEEKLSPEEFDLRRLLDDVVEDMVQLVTILAKVYDRLSPQTDDKLQQIVHVLGTNPRLSSEKVVIFTEFRDTARYVYTQLKQRGFKQVEEIDSTRKLNRERVIKRFSPYYNEPDPGELEELLHEPIRVLISTDVLSEGLNLQDAQLLVNYDLHWNPVRLMQRIGRVDRRLDRDLEAKLARKNQTIEFWNFLPPGELEEVLGLFQRLTGKVVRINRTLGIEGALLSPDDPAATQKDFNEKYEGQESVEERLKLELERIAREYPDLYARLGEFPRRVLSGKKAETADTHRGLFCAYRFPSLEPPAEGEPPRSGEVRWYFRISTGQVVEGLDDIDKTIRCLPETPRHLSSDAPTLAESRRAIERHIKDTYLRSLQAPLGYKPVLVCWMEVS